MIAALIVLMAQTSIVSVNRLIVGECAGKVWTDKPGRRHLGKELEWRQVLANGLGTPETFKLVQGGGSFPDHVYLGENVTDIDLGPTFRVRVAGSKPKTPKLVALNPRDRALLDFVRFYVRSKGITNPKVVIDQALAVDLDRDGMKEVLISARSRTNPTIESKDDYCVALLRARVGQAMKTIELGYYSNYRQQYGPFESEFVGFADYDGDGTFEFIHAVKDPWGELYGVYRVRRGRLVKLSEVGEGD